MTNSKSQKKLIVDGQIFQTPALFRGMGKYSIELLTALNNKNSREKRWSGIEIIFSNRLRVGDELDKVLKNELKDFEQTFLPLKRNEFDTELVRQKNSRVINKYIDKASSNIDYLILSLMQGEIVPTFPSVSGVNKLLLTYDLIPLMLHDIYLADPIARKQYLPKIKELLNADQYFCISKTCANDLGIYLDIDKSRISSIDGGAIKHSTRLKKYDIPKPYILMPTGNDLRKNNYRAVQGFKEFNEKHGNKYSLVITSFFETHEIDSLSGIAPNIIFTGNISGEEMNYLYKNTELLLFPSEYEGLGMPILEAMESGKPIACSDISVFREMTTTGLSTFDYAVTSDIARAIEDVVSGKVKANEHLYKEVLSRYSWEQTAEKFFTQLKSGALTEPADFTPRLKMAVFLPNPANNEVGRYVQTLHAEICRLFDVEYKVRKSDFMIEQRIDYISAAAKVIDLPKYDTSKYDLVLYYIDDTPDSSTTLLTALANPGVVVLYDNSLKRTWQSLVDHKIINDDRYRVEDNLSNGNFLTSLVERSKLVIDQSLLGIKSGGAKYDHQANRDLIELLGKFTKTELRYPEIIALKQKTRLLFNKNIDQSKGQSPMVTLDLQDRKRNELYEKAKSVEFSNTKQLLAALDALKFNTQLTQEKSKGDVTDIPIVTKRDFAETLHKLLIEDRHE